MPRGRGGGRGGRRGGGGHKGQRRQFTNAEGIAEEQAKKEKQEQWRKQKGIESESGESGDEDAPRPAGVEAAPKREMPPSESDESSSEEEIEKPKGISHLIEIENPNHAIKKTAKKVTEMSDDTKVTLSRREREELEKQQATAHYQKLHAAGKTEEAQSDMARLAIIRKQREEAAKKRDAEKKAAEDAAKAKAAAKGRGK